MYLSTAMASTEELVSCTFTASWVCASSASSMGDAVACAALQVEKDR